MSQGDSLADLLTFISPICILILFFMCFFRFILKSCSCNNSDDDAESTCNRDIRSTSSTTGIHSYHGVHDGYPSPYGEFMFCPNNPDDPFPPKYEDALKMAVCSERLNEQRRLSDQDTLRPHLCSPPPEYTEDSRENNQQNQRIHELTIVNETQEELPPNYSPNLSAQRPSSSTGSTTINGAIHPILRLKSALKRTQDTSECNQGNSMNNQLESSRISSDVINESIPTVSSTVQHQQQQQSDNHRRSSLKPPRIPLPGAVEESDESDKESITSTTTRITHIQNPNSNS